MPGHRDRSEERPSRSAVSGVLRRGAVLTLFPAYALLLRSLGVHFTPDSVEYVGMARSLARDGVARGFDGEVATLWPAAFSVLLAPWSALGADVVRVLPWMHAALWTALTAFVVLPMASACRSRAWGGALLVALLVGGPVLTVTSSLLADATLVALVLVAGWSAERVLRGDGGRAWWLLFGAAAAAPLVKLVGVATWAAVVVATFARGGRAKARLFGALFVPLPLLAWILRNQVAAGHVVERFPGDPRPLGPTVRRTLEYVARWILPQVDSTDVLLIGAALGAGGLALLARRGRLRPSWSGAGAWIALAIALMVATWWGSTRQRVDLPDARLLAPLFAVVAVLVVRTGDAFFSTRGGRRPALVAAGAWIVWTAWGGVQVVRQHPFADRAGLYDHTSAFAGRVRAATEGIDPRTRIWSNVPEWVAWHADRSAQWCTAARMSGVLDEPGRPVELVWFDRSARTGMLDPDALEAWVQWHAHDAAEGVQRWSGVVRGRP